MSCVWKSWIFRSSHLNNYFEKIWPINFSHTLENLHSLDNLHSFYFQTQPIGSSRKSLVLETLFNVAGLWNLLIFVCFIPSDWAYEYNVTRSFSKKLSSFLRVFIKYKCHIYIYIYTYIHIYFDYLIRIYIYIYIYR